MAKERCRRQTNGMIIVYFCRNFRSQQSSYLAENSPIQGLLLRLLLIRLTKGDNNMVSSTTLQGGQIPFSVGKRYRREEEAGSGKWEGGLRTGWIGLCAWALRAFQVFVAVVVCLSLPQPPSHHASASLSLNFLSQASRKFSWWSEDC